MSDSSKTSHGLLHTLKDKMFHGEQHEDTDYEALHKKFQSVYATMRKIKINTANYASSVYSVFNHANCAASDFSTLLEEATIANPYQRLAIQARTSHNRLNSEKQQQIANELMEHVLKPIEEGLREFGNLQLRINKRDALHNDFEYYLNKVHGLSKDRNERSTVDKIDTSSESEKFDRNQLKLATARTEYQNFTSVLMTDLNNAWSNRIALLGPCLASFVEAEKHFLEIYGNEINEIRKSNQLIETPLQPIAPVPLVPGDLPSNVITGDVQANPVPGAFDAAPIGSASTNLVINQPEVVRTGDYSNPSESGATSSVESRPHVSSPHDTGNIDLTQSASRITESQPSVPFAASNVVFDASPIAVEQQAYVFSSSNIAGSVSNGNSGKVVDDAKYQNEQDEKVFP